MKKILLLALALVSTQVMARSTVNSSWAGLKKDYSLNIQWPAAKMNHGPATGVDFLCDAGDHFRTLKPIQKCVRQAVKPGRNGGLYCAEYTTSFGTVEKVQSYERCVRYSRSRENEQCLQYETRTFEVASTYMVTVNKQVGNDRERFLFKKSFTIPACK